MPKQDDERPNSPRPYWSRQRVVLAGAIVFVGLGSIIAAAAYTWHRSRQPDPEQRSVAGLRRAAQWRQLSILSGFDTDNLRIPRERIESGGPPKDGIPSLTNPDVVPAGRADFMTPQDRVVGITLNGESRAYPIRILTWHECVNDVVGGVPVAVIYCPLCDSVSVVNRRLDGQTYEFGISGLLYNSNVLLFDRTDDALWSQVGLSAVSGPNAGRALRHLDTWRLTRFAQWIRDQPDSSVVTTDTGHQRDYGKNPYAAYLRDPNLFAPLPVRDDRLLGKMPVVGIKSDGVTRAYPVDLVINSPERRIRDEFGGGIVELVAEAGRDSVNVATAPDHAKVVYTFWFAWVAFHPDTQLYAPSGAAAATTQPAR